MESHEQPEIRVGIRELKANLSSFVKRAAAGEAIIVTDRGEPTARLVAEPVRPESALERGVREGWIRRGLRDDALARRTCDAIAPRESGPSASDVVISDRADRT